MKAEGKPSVRIDFEVLYALAYLHDHNIIHRDVKTESIFLSSTSGVKLGDFGFSVQVRALALTPLIPLIPLLQLPVFDAAYPKTPKKEKHRRDNSVDGTGTHIRGAIHDNG